MHKHILARSVGLALLASGLLAGCGDKDGAQQAMGEMPPAAVDVVTLHTAPLQLLSELAQMFSDRAFREQLMSAPDSLAVHGLFAGWGSDASDDGSPAV